MFAKSNPLGALVPFLFLSACTGNIVGDQLDLGDGNAQSDTGDEPGDFDAPPSFACEVGVTWDADDDAATPCVSVTPACEPGHHETAAPTASSDRSCEACIPGEFCAGGTTAPASCTVGATYDHDFDPTTACVPVAAACSAGHYQTQAPSVIQNRACTACVAGEYCAGGSTVPASCQAGSTYDDDLDSATVCVAIAPPCSPGYYETQAPTLIQDRACTTCNAGEYCVGGSAVPASCQAGSTYDGDLDPATVCVAIAPPCSPGYYETQAPTLIQDRACTTCNAGEYCAGGSAVPASCQAGSTYDDDLDPATVCVAVAGPCAAGTYESVTPSVTANRACTACVAGEYCAGGTADRAVCEVGVSYDDDLDPTTPCIASTAPCLAGTYESNAATSTSDRECTDCAAGVYCAGGSTDPVACVAGTDFDDDLDPQTPCVAVSPTCAAGSYETLAPSTTGDRTCTSCVPGEFCPGDTTSPVSCVSGVSFDHDLDPATACLATENCNTDARQTASPTATSDRQCVPCPENFTTGMLNGTECTIFSVPTFDAIYAGLPTCAIRSSDGTVQCWGYNELDVAARPPDYLFSFVDPERGACGLLLANSEVRCWGFDLYGMVSDAPVGISLSKLDVGWRHACALRADNGEAICWGLNAWGATTTPSGVAFTDIAVVRDSSCGVRANDGEVECWGEFNTTLPSVAFSSIEIHERHRCGIRADNENVECWGTIDTYGVIADAPAGVPFSQIEVGYYAACGVRVSDGELQCWGTDTYGIISDAPAGYPVASFEMNYYHACVLNQLDGTPYCWGFDSLFRASGLPTGQTYTALLSGRRPICGTQSGGALECLGSTHDLVLPPSTPAFSKIAIGQTHGCGIRSVDSFVQCWGANDYGQANVPNNVAYTSISASQQLTCVLRESNGRPECYGNNAGTFVITLTPTVAMTAIAVGGGNRNACGIVAADSSVRCWGTDDDLLVSTEPSGTFSDLSVTFDGACAIRSDTSEAACWGTMFAGNPEPAGVTFSKVVVGYDYACGIRSDTQHI